MTRVNFYDHVEDALLRFAVIIARHNGKWVFCKHRERSTWEVPGGHREAGEDILDTAKRELFGKLYVAEIHTFEKELHSEIERIAIMDELPERWTYPEIQPKLLEEAGRRGFLPE